MVCGCVLWCFRCVFMSVRSCVCVLIVHVCHGQLCDSKPPTPLFGTFVGYLKTYLRSSAQLQPEGGAGAAQSGVLPSHRPATVFSHSHHFPSPGCVQGLASPPTPKATLGSDGHIGLVAAAPMLQPKEAVEAGLSSSCPRGPSACLPTQIYSRGGERLLDLLLLFAVEIQ